MAHCGKEVTVSFSVPGGNVKVNSTVVDTVSKRIAFPGLLTDVYLPSAPNAKKVNSASLPTPHKVMVRSYPALCRTLLAQASK